LAVARAALQVSIVKSRFLIPQVLVSVLISGCLGNSGDPSQPPSNVQVHQGDGALSLTWDFNPALTYNIFYAQDPTLTTVNWTTLLGAGAVDNAGSPTILCSRINNPDFTPIFPQIFFTVDAHSGTAPGGNGSGLVAGAARPAGGPDAPWIAGPTLPIQVSGLGYAPVTGCGYAGRPPSGIYVAVGPTGSIYYSVLSPSVAGPLTAAQGNSAMTWVAGNLTLGFSASLSAVAGYAATGNNPAAPNLVFAAVGKDGTVLRSTDGANWEPISNIPTAYNLNAVAVAGSTFIAVGDNGVVITSPDGLNWSLSSISAQLSNNKLNAIHCAGSSCVAVGQAGTTLWTGNAGGTWSLYPFSTNTNWIGIAYGNNDANADALLQPATSTLELQNASINTWVVVDAQGNYALATSTGAWASGNAAIAPSITAIDYTTRFVALDSAGNAYASENGIAWTRVGASNVPNPVAIVSNSQGYVAIGASGVNASSF
jgi:hypothetical protein